MACQQQRITYSEWELVVNDLQFPEGPAWDYNKTLYFSNCYGGWITRVTEMLVDTFATASDSTFIQTNGLVCSGDGFVYACDYKSGTIVRFDPSGKCSTFISGYEGHRFNRPNDIILDKSGNLYFTDPKSYAKDIKDGRLFRYNIGTKSLILATDSLMFPNGLAISPLDNKMYLSESAGNEVVRFSINPDGKLSQKERFIHLPGGDPDGLDFDQNGNLYIAHFGSGTLFILSPQGEILHQIKTPGRKPSNIEFGGSDLRTVYLTEDESNAVYLMHVNIPGHFLH